MPLGLSHAVKLASPTHLSKTLLILGVQLKSCLLPRLPGFPYSVVSTFHAMYHIPYSGLQTTGSGPCPLQRSTTVILPSRPFLTHMPSVFQPSSFSSVYQEPWAPLQTPALPSFSSCHSCGNSFHAVFDQELREHANTYLWSLGMYLSKL